MKDNQQILYSLKDIASRLSISPKAVAFRLKKQNIRPRKRPKSNAHWYTRLDFDMIDTRQVEKEIEVIYVTRTTEIIHSKLNFNQLHEL